MNYTYGVGELPPGKPVITRMLVQFGRGVFHKVYLRRYFRLQPEQLQKLAAWQLPIAVARLGYGIEGEQSQLLTMIEAWLDT